MQLGTSFIIPKRWDARSYKEKRNIMRKQAWQRENEFEKRIQYILDYLKSPDRYDAGFLPRPFFIEFTGSPSSGKTTVITELDKFLRRHGLRVLCPQEGAEVIRHISRKTPLYNIRTALYALQYLIDLSHGHLYDVVIFDRCIFDSYCWMMNWREKNLLNKEEEAIIQSFYLSRFWVDMIDKAYFMICDPEVAMDREHRIALSRKLGETTNMETIRALVSRYQEAFRILSPQYTQLTLINTTNLDEITMVESVAEDVLKALEAKAKTGLKSVSL